MHQQLRFITLQQQGLTTLSPFGTGIYATQRAIECLGYVQIDTLAVVERAHHHILWTRIPDYQPQHLSELVRKRSIFEYWSHAASYLPMVDFRFALPQMSAIKRGESSYFRDVDSKYTRHVLERIQTEGPLRARDFQSSAPRNSKWWDWKPTKCALEKLFMQGDLMVTGRNGMEKIYDLTERVLPDGINTSEPSLSEFAEYLLSVSLKANGFTTLKQLTHLRTNRLLRSVLNEILHQKVAEGLLIECVVEGMPTVYTTKKMLDMEIKSMDKNIRILSPFDNAIIHRDKVQQIFGFEYKLECYVPKEKRKFGYFSLPILYKDKLIGRVDCKAHRKIKYFELIHFHLEAKEIDLDEFLPEFTRVINRFARFNECNTMQVSNCSPKKLLFVLKKHLTIA